MRIRFLLLSVLVLAMNGPALALDYPPLGLRVVISGRLLGCPNFEHWKTYRNIVMSGRIGEGVGYLVKNCRYPLPEGTELRIEKISTAAEAACARPVGAGVCYWLPVRSVMNQTSKQK